jgi:peptidoglycan/LPS O-acetylase OafA/YrhL
VARHPGLCWAAALATYLLLSLIVASAPQNFQYSDAQTIADHLLRGLLAFLIVVPAVLGADGGGWPRRLLATRGLRWLGEISYGIYLWHLPLLLWLVHKGVDSPALLLPLTLAWTIACASLSYYLVERPILRFKDGRPARARRSRSSRADGARPGTLTVAPGQLGAEREPAGRRGRAH